MTVRLLLAVFFAAMWGTTCTPEFECTEAEEITLYEKRIRPLLEDDRPSSCNQCHLSGIDLKLWARPTACETMACLAHEGLVDLRSPENSLVLQWIDRAQPESTLITASVIAEEREGFLQWIRRTAQCGLCQVEGNPCGEPGELPDDTWSECTSIEFVNGVLEVDDPGDCSDKTLEMLFQKKVYQYRNRCYPCHHNVKLGSTFPDAPKWVHGGACNTASLATMREVLRRGWVDVAQPEKSLLLLKPLSLEQGGVEHGGDDKFADRDDASYVDMLYWIERYANCSGS